MVKRKTPFRMPFNLHGATGSAPPEQPPLYCLGFAIILGTLGEILIFAGRDARTPRPSWGALIGLLGDTNLLAGFRRGPALAEEYLCFSQLSDDLLCGVAPPAHENPPRTDGHAERVPKILSFGMDSFRGRSARQRPRPSRWRITLRQR